MTTVLVVTSIVLLVGLLYFLFMSSYSQVFGYFPWRVRTRLKQIAITFDDGPNDPYTTELLDYLDAKKVSASFFLVGKCIERYPETAKRIYKSGHLVANHTLSHQFHKYFTSPSMKQEIEASQQIIKNLLGVTPRLYRSPWLFRQPLILKNLRLAKLTPVSGEFCHSLEVLSIKAENIASAALKKAKPGAILIFHDGREGRGGNRRQSIDAAKLVIDELLDTGYQLVTVDKLLGVKPYS